MDIASKPGFTATPFAKSATGTYRNTVPDSASATPGAASYDTGFVPANFQPIASGGIPPFGGDFNGVLFDITSRVQYEQAGGNYPFDATFSTAIGGYPKGAIVLRSDSKGQWLSTTDNNTTDPDSGSAAGWIALRANTGSAAVSTTGGTATPTPTQLGNQIIIVSGALTSNATLRLPLTSGAQWTVVNKTTGAFSLTVAGISGSGFSVAQNSGVIAYTDGTNYYSINAAISGSYLPIDGTAVAATKLATPRNFSLGGTGSVLTSATVAFDGSGNVVIKADMANNALSIAKTSGLQTSLDAKASLSGAAFSGAVSSPQITGGDFHVGTYAYLYPGGTYSTGMNIRTGSGGGVPYKYFIFDDTGSLSLPALVASGAISGATVSASGVITAAGGFQVG